MIKSIAMSLIALVLGLFVSTMVHAQTSGASGAMGATVTPSPSPRQTMTPGAPNTGFGF